jgi:hypothetical protein
MTDEGWDGQLHCPDNSDSSPTVFINGCDSGVTNTQGPYTTFPKPKKHGNVAAGCTIADTFNACNQFDPTIPEQQGDYKKCVAAVAKQLVSQDVITKDDKNAIVDCATP